MPEGDTIYGAARRIRSALIGKEIASIETHRRFARDRWPERLGGRARALGRHAAASTSSSASRAT